LVDLRDLYVSAAQSLSAANRRLEDTEDSIAYAVVESDISVPYLSMVAREGAVFVRLPDPDDLDQATARVNLKIRPVPRVDAETAPKEEAPPQVPKLDKLSLDDALSTLYASGLRVGKVLYATKAGPRGMVSRQSPAAGTAVELGTAVDLQVAGEPLKIEIPPEEVGVETSQKAPRPTKKVKTTRTKKKR
jgi:hypothetical protein